MKTFFGFGGFLIALMVIGSAAAQPRSSTPPRGERAAGPPGAVSRYGPGFERVMDVLTDDQRASLRDAMESQREHLRELEEKMRNTRRDLFLVSLAEKFDEDAVRQKAMAAAKVEAEMAVMRIKAFSQVRPALSREQLKSIQTAFAAESGRRGTQTQRDQNDLPPKDRPAVEPSK